MSDGILLTIALHNPKLAAPMKDWQEKLKDRDVIVGVLGLGYVGLPLAREFALEGIKVLGFDIDAGKVKTLNSGRSIIKHVPHRQVRDMVESGCFSATTNMARLKTVDAITICVPTPLTQNREPDMQFVISSTSTDHSDYDYDWIVKHSKLVVDTRNATALVRRGARRIVKA